MNSQHCPHIVYMSWYNKINLVVDFCMKCKKLKYIISYLPTQEITKRLPQNEKYYLPYLRII